MERICKYNCFNCELHSTIEEKNICSNFMSVRLLGKLCEDFSELTIPLAHLAENVNYLAGCNTKAINGIDIMPVTIENQFKEDINNDGE